MGRNPAKYIKDSESCWKIKVPLSKQEYMRIYPTGSVPRKVYGTAKKYKVSVNGNINDVPLCPIIFKIGTASYQLAKYLAKLLSPLSTSEYTVTNTIEFTNNLKTMKIPKDQNFISFDIKPIFTFL